MESDFYSKVLHCRIDQSFAAVKALFANFKSFKSSKRTPGQSHTVAHCLVHSKGTSRGSKVF